MARLDDLARPRPRLSDALDEWLASETVSVLRSPAYATSPSVDFASALVSLVSRFPSTRVPMKLNDHERRIFEDRGLLHLKRLIPKTKTKAAKEAIFGELTRLGVRAAGKWHSSKFPRQLRHQPEFDNVIPDDLLSCLIGLAGCKLALAQARPQILLTPPQSSTWSVPHLGWHLDVASPARDEIPGIQAFVLIDDIVPQGGGTVAISGSHKLHSLRGGVAISAHRVLQEDSGFAALFAPGTGDRREFLASKLVNGVTVQVTEMSGEAGDVYLMDMRTIHAPATNATRNLRIMLTSRYISQWQ